MHGPKIVNPFGNHSHVLTLSRSYTQAAGLVRRSEFVELSSPPAKRLNAIQPDIQPGTSVVVGGDTKNGRWVGIKLVGGENSSATLTASLHPTAFRFEIRLGILLVVCEDTNNGLSPGV
jgi:hypothetical protein